MPNTALHESGFICDTEPASRATVAVRTWRYFKAVQQAFYAEGKNVTRPGVLADLAQAQGLPRAEFAQSKRWDITGFPALVAERGDALHLVCRGYTPIATLRQNLSELLAA